MYYRVEQIREAGTAILGPVSQESYRSINEQLIEPQLCNNLPLLSFATKALRTWVEDKHQEQRSTRGGSLQVALVSCNKAPRE